MEDEKLLQALESAYNRGVTFEQIQGNLSDEALIIAQDFYSKKKDGTEDSQIASPSVSISEPSRESGASLSTQLGSDSQAIAQGVFNSIKSAQERGITLGQLEGNVSQETYDLAKQYYATLEANKPHVRAMKDHWLIIDDNPSEIGRLWNRAVAGGILANEVQEGELSGSMDYEKIAYLNHIIERDAPKDSDYLFDQSGSAVDDFVLDVIRTIPESLISMATAFQAGAAGAAAGAGTGAAAGSVIPGAGTAAGAGTGAIAGYFGGASLGLEYAYSVMDVLKEEGVDVTSPDQLANAVKDEEIMSKAREKGLKRGIPIAIFDAISGGVAGKVGTTLVKSVGKSATNRAMKVAAAETLVQAALGGGGELAGQVISGEEIRPRDIALEAFAEIGPAAPVMAYNLAGRIGKTPGELEYIDWAKEQDQGALARANEVSFVLNNGKISAIDKEIASLKESKNQDPTVRKAVDTKIRQLRDEKYRLLKETSERVLSIEGEQSQRVSEFAESVYRAKQVLENGDLDASEKAAVEQELRTAYEGLENELRNVEQSEETTTDDTKTGTEEVPSGEQVGQEPGDVPKSQASEAQAFIDRILQAREQEEELRSDTELEQAVQDWKESKTKFIELGKSKGVQLLRALMKEGYFLPTEQRMMNKLILASEAYRKLNPGKELKFNVGFGKKGYYAAGKLVGLPRKKMQGSAGITFGGKAGPVIVEIQNKKESIEGRGKEDRYNPVGTGYHEVFHKIFTDFFDNSPIDFNQMRKLVIRRLSQSDAKELNDFTNRYEERDDKDSAGAYKSEEFMVQLGALLGNDRIQFSPSFLEELKAFLNAVVGKITGQRVQIFEDAALAKDIAAYMTGVAKTIKAGGDLSQVKMSERLQTDRFKRDKPFAEEKKEVDEYGFEKGTGEFEQFPGKNKAGLPDPENYKRTLDPLEKILGFIRPKFNNTVKALEKKLGVERLRGVRRDVLQALEVSESINVQHVNRFYLAFKRVNSITNKMDDATREKVADLANDFLFSPEEGTRKTAIEEINKINPELARELGRLYAIRQSLQEIVQDSSVFANMSEDLRETLKDNTAFYGTRTYRAFTDPNFKFDPALRRAAERAMVEIAIEEEFDYFRFEMSEEEFAKEQEKAAEVGFNLEEDDDLHAYIEATRKDKIRTKVNNSLRGLEEAALANRGRYGDGLSGAKELGKLRIPTKKLKQRLDLPIELQDYLGIEKDPYIKFSQTIATLTNMTQQFTLADRVNEIAQRSQIGNLILTGSVLKQLQKGNMTSRDMLQLAQDTGLMNPGETNEDFAKRMGYKDFADMEGELELRSNLQQILLDYIKKNYTVIEEKKSPMNGKAVKNDFVSMLKMTPLYESDNTALQAYYKLLLQMRRVRVLFNLPTWRKNIMGGWYFLGANFVLPFGKHRGGLDVMRDLKNRFKKLKDGVVDPELEIVFNRMGELGLLGSSPNMAVFGDINQSFMDQIDGVPAEQAWGWLPKGMQKAQRELGVRQSRIAYHYGFIDDYTKMIAYLTKRENFARRLESNPEGKSYSELNPAQQQQVDEAVAERIKQNMPTMSRIHPAFRNLFKLPAGDFLSFRVEAFRSYFSIYKNAVNDLREAVTNQNLTQSQKRAYFTDAVGTLTMGLTLMGLSTMGYQALASMLLKDDEEEELGREARGANYILPPWMQGANIVAVDMKKDGTIRFANMSSEDPYDEIFGLIFGRDGISRNDALINIASDFKDPNLAVRLLYNLVEGKDSYGRPILDNEDVGWFHRYIIGPSLTEWSDSYGSYIFKETFLPPNMNYIAREYRKRMKAAAEDPDLELQPLETAAELSTALIFRDYPVKIQKQFYYNIQEQNFRMPYRELSDTQKVNRQARLDEVKRAYQFIVNYATKFDNFQIISSVESTINRTFAKSPEEAMYILYDLDLNE